ncbi:MAG: Rap1a/Tai family immunity protein, partial [Burkholderiaceae bacterium]
KDPRLCVRTEIQINEVVTLVRGQLNTRPDVHRYNAASVVRETLATEFPCT